MGPGRMGDERVIPCIAEHVDHVETAATIDRHVFDLDG